MRCRIMTPMNGRDLVERALLRCSPISTLYTHDTQLAAVHAHANLRTFVLLRTKARIRP